MTPGFQTPLFFELLNDDAWRITRKARYYSEVLGREVVIPRNFETDFASVPRLPGVYMLLGGVGKKAAVVHDFLYRRSGVSRRDADKVFYEALKWTGVPYWRRASMWVGLRIGGWTAYRPSEPEPQPPQESPSHEPTNGA